MSKINVIILTAGLMLILSPVVMAQDAPVPVLLDSETTSSDELIIAPISDIDPEVEDEVLADIEEDEDVSADDLDVGKPGLLPDSKLYFLKSWGRSIRSLFTFGKLKQAKLDASIASEKLLELKALVEKQSKEKILEKTLAKYNASLEKVKNNVDKIENGSTSDAVGKFMAKFTEHQLLHDRILTALDQKTNIATTVRARIRTTREAHVQKFGEVMTKLQSKEQMEETLQNAVDKIKGSEFKDLKNLDVLKRIEEKVPENAKQAIKNVMEKTTEKLHTKIQEITPGVQEKFGKYIEKMQAADEIKVEIVEDLKARAEQNLRIKQNLNDVQFRVLEKVRIRAKEENKNCPLDMINPYACKGRVITEKDGNGCVRTRCEVKYAPEDLLKIDIINKNQPEGTTQTQTVKPMPNQ